MVKEKEMSDREILARAYKWFGVKAPSGHTFAVRDDYMMTMKALRVATLLKITGICLEFLGNILPFLIGPKQILLGRFSVH